MVTCIYINEVIIKSYNPQIVFLMESFFACVNYNVKWLSYHLVDRFV